MAASAATAASPPSPSREPVEWRFELHGGASLRPEVDPTAMLGAGLGVGPLRLDVEGGLPGGVVEDGTLQRGAASLGAGWSPAGPLTPEVAGGIGAAVLWMHDPDLPTQAALTPFGWAELGLRLEPGPAWAVRLYLRGGADLRATSVQPVEGAAVTLGRGWLEPGLAIQARFR